MPHFRCVPIATETAAQFRTTRFDQHDNHLRRMQATPEGRFPCRHCLQHAKPGEWLLLGSYDLIQPKGIYWTPSPIFIHEDACPTYDRTGEVAPIIAENTLVSVRAYDSNDQCLYDLGVVCEGKDAEAPITNAMADRRTAFVNVHTARPGCLLARVERL